MQALPKASGSKIPNGGKRSLLDYFSPTAENRHKVQRLGIDKTTSASVSSPSPCAPAVRIPGLQLIDQFISPEEEAHLLSFLETQTWRTDLSRRVIHYGGTYCIMPPRNATPDERKKIESNILTALPIPKEVDVFVISRMIEHDLYTESNRPEYCIVNQYTGNNGISAHVENFKFDSPVCGLTLGSGDWIRFHELTAPNDGSVRSGKAALAERTGRKVDVWLSPRSLLVMTGEVREKWQHEIVRGKKGRTGPNWKRTSLTFRTLKAKK